MREPKILSQLLGSHALIATINWQNDSKRTDKSLTCSNSRLFWRLVVDPQGMKCIGHLKSLKL